MSVDIQKVDPSTEPNRPHISSDIKFSKNTGRNPDNKEAKNYRTR